MEMEYLTSKESVLSHLSLNNYKCLLGKCAICNEQITTQNDSNEHIIPNAVGGRKTITGFICKSCNNESGAKWDSELVKQLNPLCLFFGISRQRGVPPPQVFRTLGGEKRKLYVDGTMDIIKSDLQESIIDNKVVIQVKAKSIKEAKTRLKGIKRKYPQFDIDEVVSKICRKTSYSHDPLQLNVSIGGQDAGRSIVKSTLALVVEAGVSAHICEHAIEYLQRVNGTPNFGYYYEKDLLKNRPKGIPIHCVFVKGNPNTKQILGYVEFFGAQRMVICLSSTYVGNEFTNTYAINPTSGNELDIISDINFSNDEIENIYQYKKIPSGSIESAFEAVAPLGLKLSYTKERDRVIDKAVTYAFANCGAKKGEYLTDKQKKKLVGLIIEKMMPFLIHNLSKETD